MKSVVALRRFFSCRKADDAGGLSPGKEDRTKLPFVDALLANGLAELMP